MKLDFSAVESYARQYAGKVCDDFFNRSAIINGQQILKLSNVAQVNTFVLGDLYERWIQDAVHFRSPFFDFENEEVTAALKTLMNTVSHHIAVKREHFEPVLAGAVSQTIVLLLDPSKYFDDFVREMASVSISKERLVNLAKYTKINNGIAKQLVERVGNDTQAYTSDVIHWLNQIAEHVQFENPDKYLEIFNTTIPCNKNQFYEGKGIGNKQSKSFFDTDIDFSKEEDIPLPTVSYVQAKIEKEGIPESPKDSYYGSSLNASFQNDLPTVNDLVSKEIIGSGKPELAFNRPVKSIADAVSLNQKFLFIGKLFEGDINAYNKALEELDRCKTFMDAKNIMNKSLAPKYNWIMAAEEANDFLEMVSRRFQ